MNFMLEKKCLFLEGETEFLGRIFSPNGIRVGENRIKVLNNSSKPNFISEFRSFIRLQQYFRRFKKVSKKMQPINQF